MSHVHVEVPESGRESLSDTLGVPHIHSVSLRYNAHCRGIVTRYTAEWEGTVKRLGRWIDFANDYKTMDPAFMESVWWVFATLHEKGLVYRGYKVSA